MSRPLVRFSLTVLLLLAAWLPAQAANEICILVSDSEGTVWNGEFGPVICDGNAIEGLEFHHLVQRDTPQARHQQVIFRKLVDATSIDFWNAFAAGERLQQVDIEFWVFNPNPVVQHRVRLQDVTVESIELLDVEPQDGGPRRDATERIRLSYLTLEISVGTSSTTLQNDRN